MKCINDKCENGLWSDDGCLFPEGTICSGFIPESEKSGVVPVESQSAGCEAKVKRRNPVRVLNDALNEYRTSHTTMTKDEFYESGCYDAFMWAWQNSTHNDLHDSCGK